MIKEKFLNPNCSPKNILTYTVREAILNAVKFAKSRLEGKVLDVGCGIMPYRELISSSGSVKDYIGMDIDGGIYKEYEVDLVWDGLSIPIGNEEIDSVIATEFFEHYHDTRNILSEIRRVLVENGTLFGTVPFIWTLHEVPYDEYRFTPFSLKKHLEESGFNDIEIYPLGGFDYSFAQFIGLWITHRKMNKVLRGLLRYLLFPIYYLLIKADKKPTAFENNVMYSGLYFFAKKS